MSLPESFTRYIIHVMALVLARNASAIDPTPQPYELRDQDSQQGCPCCGPCWDSRPEEVLKSDRRHEQSPASSRSAAGSRARHPRNGNGAACHVAIDLGEGTISAWQVGNGDQFAEAADEYRVGVDREGAVDLGILFLRRTHAVPCNILIAARAARVNVRTDEVILLRIRWELRQEAVATGVAIAYREGAGARHIAHHTAVSQHWSSLNTAA